MGFGVTGVSAIARFFVTEGEAIVLGSGEAMEVDSAQARASSASV